MKLKKKKNVNKKRSAEIFYKNFWIFHYSNL